MKTVGIIAEYNPFHNGHAYQISKVRKERQADFVVVAMSGDFVQRGTPAIIDKYTRTRMALCTEADLVIEIPVLYATSSAESFAMAGITLFDKMGCIDEICFGAETDSLPLLSEIADVLAEEPEVYRTALASNLKKGMNFPSARAKALCDAFGSISLNAPSQETLSALLNAPNNILALEYLKALKKRHSNIQPFLLQRNGAGYHDVNILSDSKKPGASATAIRNLLQSKEISEMGGIKDLLETVMPAHARFILLNYLSEQPALSVNDFSQILGYQLLRCKDNDFDHIYDITPEIANRIKNNLYQYKSFSQFCELNKSRDITYTRISRILLHLLLSLTSNEEQLGRQLDYIPYLRMLGFQKDASPLLSVLKESASVPVISKLSAAKNILSADSLRLLQTDIFASELYRQVRAVKESHSDHPSPGHSFSSEYSQKIVIVSHQADSFSDGTDEFL